MNECRGGGNPSPPDKKGQKNMLTLDNVMNFIEKTSKITDERTARTAALKMKTHLPPNNHVFYGIKYEHHAVIYFYPIQMSDEEFSQVERLNRSLNNTVFALHSPPRSI
jgi:hypothetical protein